MRQNPTQTHLQSASSSVFISGRSSMSLLEGLVLNKCHSLPIHQRDTDKATNRVTAVPDRNDRATLGRAQLPLAMRQMEEERIRNS